MKSRHSCAALAATLLLVVASPAWSQELPLVTAPALERLPASPTPAAIDSPMPPFSELFTHSLGDLRRLSSRESLTWLGVGAVASMAARPADRRVTDDLTGSARLSETFESGQHIGGVAFQLSGAFAAYGLGRATSNRRLAVVGVDLFRAQLLAQIATQAIKFSVNRTRPDGTAFSFPSGHTSTTFASATVLQRHLGWKAGIPAYAVAVYVATSRIEEKRHFLSDVAFGAALGIAAGRTVTVGRGNGRFALAPSAVPGGGALSLTWIGRD